MKKLLSAIFLMGFFSLQSFAQTTITPDEASKHIGETVNICGKVFGGRFFESSEKQTTLLNMGAAFPASPVTIVISGENRKKFSFKPEEFYKDKNICVKGEVKEFKGKSEIHVTEVSQITYTEDDK